MQTNYKYCLTFLLSIFKQTKKMYKSNFRCLGFIKIVKNTFLNQTFPREIAEICSTYYNYHISYSNKSIE